jgi:hypothetical protein
VSDVVSWCASAPSRPRTLCCRSRAPVFTCDAIGVLCCWQPKAAAHQHAHTHTHPREIVSELRNGHKQPEDQVCDTHRCGSCDQLTLTRLLRCGRRCLPCAMNAHRSCDHTFTCGSEQGAHQKPTTQSHTITSHHNTRVCSPTQHTQPLSPPPLLCNPTQSNGGIMATAKKDRSRVVMNLSKDDVVRRDDAGLVCSWVLVCDGVVAVVDIVGADTVNG